MAASLPATGRVDAASAAGASGVRPRFVVIDALRGCALFGVFAVNLRSFSLYEFLDPAARAALPTAAVDAALTSAMALLVDGKAITVFSLLFGVGFALQMGRIADGDRDGLRRYLRRLGVLAMIGLLHAVFVWWGDILLTYAVVGLLLVPLRRAKPRWLLVAAVVLAVLLPPLLSPWMRGLLVGVPRQPEMYAAALEGFASPELANAWRTNLHMAAWARVANWALVGFVLGRFLLGDWAGRAGLLQDPWRHRRLLGRVCVGALLLGVLALWLDATQAALRGQHAWLDGAVGKYAIRAALRVEPLALGIAFAAGFAWLYAGRGGARVLSGFAPVGRMALTHYLLQSLLCVPLFYGLGLGVGPGIGLIGVLAVGVAVFALQVLTSAGGCGAIASDRRNGCGVRRPTAGDRRSAVRAACRRRDACGAVGTLLTGSAPRAVRAPRRDVRQILRCAASSGMTPPPAHANRPRA